MIIQYLHPSHSKLPHVVKFSGGRSSAMMLLELLEYNQLSAPRGDVILFNNTSAEHLETYKFVVRCKELVESKFEIPFFMIEFQTYEDAWLGRWRRAATYRMVKPYPHRNYKNKHSYGYRHNGEVFQELVSWNAQLPTRFARTCTEYLKLQTSVHFLEDWFGRISEKIPIPYGTGKCKNNLLKGSVAKKKTRRLGHYFDKSLMPIPESFGTRSEKVRFHLQQPTVRLAQTYQDYTKAPVCEIQNQVVKEHVFDHKARVRGIGALPFISLVGLREDEPVRVARTLARNHQSGYGDRMADGEIVYAPLFDSGINKKIVLDYWRNQTFELDIPHDVNLSNCVFCFMKGARTIRELAKNHSFGDGPSNIQWWADLESMYSNRVTTRGKENSETVFGFFGANALTYQDIVNGNPHSPKDNQSTFLPCECTD